MLRGLDLGQLGTTAQARGRLDKAEDWYRKSLAIEEELGNLPGMALAYGQLGLLAEARQRPRQALDWMIRVRGIVQPVPTPGNRARTLASGPAGQPARHASPRASLAAGHRPAGATAGP